MASNYELSKHVKANNPDWNSTQVQREVLKMQGEMRKINRGRELTERVKVDDILGIRNGASLGEHGAKRNMEGKVGRKNKGLFGF